MTGNTNKKSDAERRQRERRELVYYLRLFDHETKEFQGYVVDLSETGVMVTGDKPFNPGHLYHFDLDPNIDIELNTEYAFEARLVWCKNIGEECAFDAGFHIHQAPPETRQLLQSFNH